VRAEIGKLRRGFGLLFSRETARRLRWAFAGSILVGLAETIGLALVLPLMEIIAGESTTTGLLGRLSAFFGHPSRGDLAAILATIIVVAFITKGVLTILFRWWMLGFLYKQEADTSTELLSRYLTGPYWLHLQRNSAELIRNMNDAVTQTYTNAVNGAVSAVAELVNIAGVALVLFVLKPVPALVATLYFGLAGLVFYWSVQKRSVTAGRVMTETAFASYRAAFQSLGGVKEIKIRRKSGYFVDQYRHVRQEFAGAKRSAMFFGDLPRYVFEVVFIVGVALMTIVVFSANSSKQALAILALFVAAGSQLLPSLTRLTASASNMRVGQRGLDLVLADLAEVAGGDRVEEFGGDPIRLDGGLSVRGLCYRYPETDLDVIHDVDFDLPAGQSLALVGPTGAGKTTLVDLLIGMHSADDGWIRADGVNIEDILPRWQRSIGLVPQEVYLLDASLRSNIAFGEDESQIDEAAVANAVKLAQLQDLVEELPKGLETVVGERGTRLSGGQRQRVGIARALYLRPAVLILDEATSSLDNETEHKISETVQALHGTLTTVVVAHRLSTVQRCDRILFLNHGVVESIGTFGDVRRENPHFNRLVELADLRP
jgi:ATP-binding cassette, subfamily B, bacterial PglK